MIFEYLKQKNQGIIKAGMSREELRKIFNSIVSTFKKTPLCNFPVDDFYQLDIHAHFDPNTEKLEGLEIFQQNRIIYKENIILLKDNLKTLIADLVKNKIPFDRDPIGIDLEKGKIGIFVPIMDDVKPECVSVFIDLTDGSSLSIKEY